MSNLAKLPSIRVDADNPNHHLWDNHGVWSLHYTIYPTPFTKERVRRSLGTRDVRVARQQRDQFFATLATAQGRTIPSAMRKQFAA
jgi:hypothetical protein